MRRLCAALISCLAIANLAQGQPAPQGPPPSLKIVASVNKDKGEITFVETVARLVPVQKAIVVIENGQQVTKTVTEYVQVLEQRMVAYNAANSRVITPDGKQLPIDEVWKRVKKDTVIAVSANGNTPAAGFLAALRADTLVMIPPMPKVPVPAPVPPEVKE